MDERGPGQTIFEVLAGSLFVFFGGLFMLLLGLPGIAFMIGFLFNINGLGEQFPLHLSLIVMFGGALISVGAYFLIRHGIRVIAGESER